jgi:hypothetical protein
MIIRVASKKFIPSHFYIDTKKAFKDKQFINENKQKTSQKAFDNYYLKYLKDNKDNVSYLIIKD